jgi:hypothetical protein
VPGAAGGTSTTAPQQTSTTAAPPDAGLPAASDFTLALADGTTFTLGRAAMPVYLVFWAEW